MNNRTTENLKISSDSYIGFKLSQLLYFTGTIITIAFMALSYFYFSGQKYDQEQREQIKKDTISANELIRMEFTKDRLYILEKIDSVIVKIEESCTILDNKIDKANNEIETLKVKKADWETKDNWIFKPPIK